MQTITHVLKIEEQVFPVHHVDRRLYKFQDWKSARESLIKILLRRFNTEFNLDTAYIEFLMANPMRKSRLGNFYVDVKAKVFKDGKYVGNEETMNFKEILIDNFEILDEEEKEIMSDRSFETEKFKSEMYMEELHKRMDEKRAKIEKSLFAGLPFRGFNEEKSRQEIEADMEKEGWRLSMDNRELFRKTRYTA